MADIVVIPEAAHYIVTDAGSGSGAGQDGRGITDAVIEGNDLILSFTSAPSPVNVGRVVGQDGTNGTNGTNGNTILSGSGVPNDNQGVQGDFYLRTSNYELFGPKFDGHWSANGVIIKGRTLLNGTTIPNNGDGNEGDFYLRTTNSQLYGPKTGNDWGNGVSLIGATGATGPAGPNNLNFLKTSQQSIENFEGNAAGTISSQYAATAQNGAALVQRSTAKAGFKSASLVDFSVATSSPQALILLRKALGANIFAYNFNPVSQLCEIETSVQFDALPTSANQFDFELRMVDTSNNVFGGNGVQARVYWDTGLNRAAIALTTLEATLASTEISATTLTAGVVYIMRIVYNRAASLCQLLLNGTVVATRTLRLPSVLLSPSVRIAKVTGTTAVTGTIDYLETVATDQ